MKKEFLIVFLLIVSIVLNGCTQKVVKVECNKPYILVGTSCCLDEDGNSICDKDEVKPEIKEEPKVEVKEEIKEKTPKTLQDYSINDLRRDVDKIIYFDLGNNWRTIDDSSNPDVICHLGSKRQIVISEIKNEADYIKDYSNFLSFSPDCKFIGEKETISEDVPTEVGYLNEYSGDKDWLLSEGKIRELAWYGKNNKTGKWHLHHSFNVYCAPNLYIRLFPEWYWKDSWWGGVGENELKTSYETDRRELIPLASQLLKKCPLKKEYTEDYTIYDLEEDLNNIYGGYFAFLKSENKHESYEGSNIKVEVDKKSNKVNYINIDYRNIFIDELRENPISASNELKDYVKKDFEIYKEETNDRRKLFEDRLKKNFEEQHLSDGTITYYQFKNLSIETEPLFLDELNILKIEGNQIIETLYIILNDYNVNYIMAYQKDNLDTSPYISQKKEQFLDFRYSVSVLCKPNLVVHLNTDEIKTYAVGNRYEKKAVENQIDEIRNKLSVEATKIADACS